MSLERLEMLDQWISTIFPGKQFSLVPASADASFRRYFRVTMDDQTLIAMDAPPQQEDCTPFLHVADILSQADVHVPKVLAKDLKQGFLLLSDLGNITFLQALNAQPEKAHSLYQEATDALIKMQLAQQTDTLPEYDEALLTNELNLFPDWYVAKHLETNLTADQQNIFASTFDQILQNVLSQPKVFVHRDYHSRNLMVTTPNPGVIDFQDAVYGPITYDLVSLLKDAYIRWDEEYILDWTIRYWEKARKAGLPVTTDFALFYRDFEWMGVQRHIKVLGIFARLYHRDGKDSYLNDMPLVMEYLRKTCERYHELHHFLNVLDELAHIDPDENIGYTF